MTRSEIIADIGKTKAEIQRLTEHLADIEKAVEQEEVTRFKPEEGEKYLYVDCFGSPNDDKFTYSISDEIIKKHNNIFRISSYANLKKYALDVIRVQNRLMQLHEELCPNFWRGSMSDEVCLGKSAGEMQWFTVSRDKEAHGFVPFTYTATRKACEILNNERFMMDDD